MDFFKNIKEENRMFYTFLIVHLIVWTLVGMIRTVMPTDALEGIYWGSLHEWGTPKHPPLAGYLTYLAYLPFKLDFFVYLMSQSFIVLGFIYIYRLAKYFLDENKAMLSVVILEGCWCYSYITGYYGFNPDVVLLFTLPAISYYFYNCMHESKLSDWVKLGIIVGFSFLNKYQTGLLILPMAIWALMFNRKVFKTVGFYLSIAIAFIIFLPHLLWLIKYDFFPLMYFEGELSAPTLINHITGPLMFLLMQIVSIAGSLVIYLLLKKKANSSFDLIKDYEKKDFGFIALLGLTPLIVHMLMGLCTGGTMRPRWGYEFWFMTGIMLFYFFPCEVGKKEFKFVIKSAYIVMLLIFLGLGGLLSIEKNYRSRYPVGPVFSDVQAIWTTEVGTPLKYLGGYIEWTLPLTIYGETHPDCILDTNGYPAPWLDMKDLKESGAFILDRTEESVVKYTKMSCPYLPEDYKIKPVEYKLTVQNAFKMPREYTVYYFIVPPEK